MRVFILATFASTIALAGAAQAEEVWLTIDQVRPHEFETPAGQIVIGNPSIADLQVQDKKRVLLFGKAPGLTNMYIFDDDGNIVDNLTIRVRSTTGDMLTMHRGPLRTTYNCAGNCEATMTVGDSKESFGDVAGQAQQKQTQLSSGAGSSQ